MDQLNHSNNIQLYSIDRFLNHAKHMYRLSKGQMAGFKIMMIRHDMTYVRDPHDYIKPLKRYLNN